MTEPRDVTERLEYLRGEIEAERISWWEIAELQGLGEEGLIPEDDLLLREWAGIPESPEPESPPATVSEVLVSMIEEWNDEDVEDADAFIAKYEERVRNALQSREPSTA